MSSACVKPHDVVCLVETWLTVTRSVYYVCALMVVERSRSHDVTLSTNHGGTIVVATRGIKLKSVSAGASACTMTILIIYRLGSIAACDASFSDR
jgi:hypothetical protein